MQFSSCWVEEARQALRGPRLPRLLPPPRPRPRPARSGAAALGTYIVEVLPLLRPLPVREPVVDHLLLPGTVHRWGENSTAVSGAGEPLALASGPTRRGEAQAESRGRLHARPGQADAALALPLYELPLEPVLCRGPGGVAKGFWGAEHQHGTLSSTPPRHLWRACQECSFCSHPAQLCLKECLVTTRQARWRPHAPGQRRHQS